MLFVDRVDAGSGLAVRLGHLRGEDVVVLGLRRGGVPVAFEVAQDQNAPPDVIVIRKLGIPYQSALLTALTVCMRCMPPPPCPG